MTSLSETHITCHHVTSTLTLLALILETNFPLLLFNTFYFSSSRHNDQLSVSNKIQSKNLAYVWIFFFSCRPGKDNQLQFFSNANRFRDVHNQLMNSPSDFQSYLYIYYQNLLMTNTKTEKMFSRKKSVAFYWITI